MRLPRVRFTVRRMMVTVAIIGMISAAVLEVRARSRDHRRRRDTVAIHRYRANFFRVAEARYADGRKELVDGYRRAAAWHEERIKGILGGTVPSSELDVDGPPDSEALLREYGDIYNRSNGVYTNYSGHNRPPSPRREARDDLPAVFEDETVPLLPVGPQ